MYPEMFDRLESRIYIGRTLPLRLREEHTASVHAEIKIRTTGGSEHVRRGDVVAEMLERGVPHARWGSIYEYVCKNKQRRWGFIDFSWEDYTRVHYGVGFLCKWVIVRASQLTLRVFTDHRT